MRVIVVEDEPIAREGLCALLNTEDAVDVVGAFASAAEARCSALVAESDAMFVDIEMPAESGVDLVRSIPSESRPYVVFVTAHEDYAATAFDMEALDYVLKPIDEPRLSEAVARVRRAVETRERERAHRQITELVAAAPAVRAAEAGPRPAAGITRISARTGNRLVVQKLADVSWMEADGDYLRLHSKGRALLVRMTMRELERRVDPAQFVRVHRSALVNIDYIVSVDLNPHGEHVAALHDGARIRVGRTYRDALFGALGERT